MYRTIHGMLRDVIALSHIHVSAAYRSRIYKSFDTPRSEPYFVRATYVPRTCDVPVTFPRMKCMRDVSTAYVLRSRIICCVSDLYQLLCNTVVFPLIMQFAHYSYQLSAVEAATREI